MSLITEVEGLFNCDAISRSALIAPALSIQWEAWRNDDIQSTIFPKLVATISSAERIAKFHDKSLPFVLKNSIASASRDQLPLARLCIQFLVRNGKLNAEANSWLKSFPPPSPIETLYSYLILNEFKPTPEAFAEMLPLATKDQVQNCLRNFLLSISPFPVSSTALLRRIKEFDSLKDVSANVFAKEIANRIGDGEFRQDLTRSGLQSLPKDWRRYILASDELIKLFLTPSAAKAILVAPHLLPDTPTAILGEELKKELLKALEAVNLSGSLVAKIFANSSIVQVVENGFDWSPITKINKPVRSHGMESFVTILHERFRRGSINRLTANLGALVLSSIDNDVVKEPHIDPKILLRFLNACDRTVLHFIIRTTKGAHQSSIINLLMKGKPEASLQKLIVDAFFAVPLDENVNLKTLDRLLLLATDREKNFTYRAAFEIEPICLHLLSNDDGYFNFFLDKLNRGELPKYRLSTDLFKICASFGERGALIIEALIKFRGKIVGRPSTKIILEYVVFQAPTLASFIFANRGIGVAAFKNLIETSSFKLLPKSVQVGILQLTNTRGKPALRLAMKAGALSDATLKWLSTQKDLRPLLARQAPAILKPSDRPLPELLAGTTIFPGEVSKTLSGIDPARIQEALPEALALLHDRPRVAAALELAVRSEISALPILMRLAQRLAPPFDKANYGRRFDDLYTTYELPKRSGGTRTISAPFAHLKAAQRALIKLLYAEGFSEQAMGFVPGRSTRDNASKHVGHDIVVNADVKAFFPSTSYKQVYALSRKLCKGELSPLAARLFAEICCHEGHLATGAPTSPAVSNLIMRNLDAILNQISSKLDVTFTRYADDLTFSGKSAAVWMLKPLTSMLGKLGYELDSKKTNIFRKGRRQIVTGAVVNSKVNLARPLRKILRAAVDYRSKGKQPTFHGKIMSDAMLNGYVSYLKMLCPDSAAPLISKLKEIPGWKY